MPDSALTEEFTNDFPLGNVHRLNVHDEINLQLACIYIFFIFNIFVLFISGCFWYDLVTLFYCCFSNSSTDYVAFSNVNHGW